MKIRDGDDMKKKYNHMIINVSICYFVGLMNIALYIWTLIDGNSAAGFIMNSSTVILLSKLLDDMYDYFIAHIKFTSNPRYNGGAHKYISIFILVINSVFYLVSLISYRMSFDTLNCALSMR